MNFVIKCYPPLFPRILAGTVNEALTRRAINLCRSTSLSVGLALLASAAAAEKAAAAAAVEQARIEVLVAQDVLVGVLVVAVGFGLAPLGSVATRVVEAVVAVVVGLLRPGLGGLALLDVLVAKALERARIANLDEALVESATAVASRRSVAPRAATASMRAMRVLGVKAICNMVSDIPKDIRKEDILNRFWVLF